MEEQRKAIDDTDLIPWEPNRYLKRVDAAEVKLSRGFLRCRPERWFPGFGSHWLTLAHSLGIELEVFEVKPVVSAPRGLELNFLGTVDDEPLALSVAEETLQSVANGVIPGAIAPADRVLAEYLARRLLTSLGMSWSGPESSVVRFVPEGSCEDHRFAGAIRFTFSINGTTGTVWISLGKLLVERLDGLWRRQIHSTTGRDDDTSELEVVLELAQLAVPPSMLAEYTKPGTVIDLETSLSDQVVLYRSGETWTKAKICLVDDFLGFEMITDPVPHLALPDGTTQLSIALGSVTMDGSAVAELSQPGAVLDTKLPATSTVRMLINNEPVGEGTLCSYEGRFAVSVR